MTLVLVVTEGDLLKHFIWKGSQIVIVSIVDKWKETGRWWSGENRAKYYVVDAETGLFLLCKLKDNRWYAKPLL